MFFFFYVFGWSSLFSSAHNMTLLAEEACGCKAELLSGGLDGNNRETIIRHLWKGQPVLIPYPAHQKKPQGTVHSDWAEHFLTTCPTSYDEDFNHEPCQRNGHRAHWAVISGKLGGSL